MVEICLRYNWDMPGIGQTYVGYIPMLSDDKNCNKLGLSSAKLSRAKFGCLEVIFEVVSKDNLK